MTRSSGTFCERRMVRANLTNCSDATATAGTPSFVNCAVSWRLHDVHDPQLANPTTAAPHSAATRSKKPFGGGEAAGIV